MRVRFSAMPTPSYDDFQTVTLSASAPGVSVHADVSVEEAEAYAQEILRWAEVVRKERDR